jgi:hypothetical protein
MKSAELVPVTVAAGVKVTGLDVDAPTMVTVTTSGALPGYVEGATV